MVRSEIFYYHNIIKQVNTFSTEMVRSEIFYNCQTLNLKQIKTNKLSNLSQLR